MIDINNILASAVAQAIEQAIKPLAERITALRALLRRAQDEIVCEYDPTAVGNCAGDTPCLSCRVWEEVRAELEKSE